jgi:hypothetical protein
MTPLAVAALAAVAAAPSPMETHRIEARVAYLALALDALAKTPPGALEHAHEYARVLEQGACASSVERLKVDCMMTAARRYCRGKTADAAARCHATMDVVVSNVLATRRLITSEKRYDIMKRFRDPKKELAREMRRIQGALAVDFHLRMGEAQEDDALGKDIDRYCTTTADETNIAWQTCASALVWYIATKGGG